MTKHPTNEWEWIDSAEEGFVEWFHSNATPYTLKSEWFYGDCTIGDIKTRESVMIEWLHLAYVSGYTFIKNK